MVRLKGVSLLETLVVIIIVTILAALMLINYGPIKEQALSREAKAELKLIIAAQKIYRLETNTSNYYPIAGGTVSIIGELNNNLKLLLNTGDKRAWDYTTKSTAATPPTVCAQADRFNGPAKTWRMADTDIEPVENSTCP